MRMGIFSEGSVSDIVEAARSAEADGFDSFWVPHIFGIDALVGQALVGAAVPRIELGTAVVPTYPRHPVTMAQQARTVQQASGGRFTLGIGLSHQLVIEGMFGYSYDKPVRHMREYLSALMPLLDGEPADIDGETLSAHAGLTIDCDPVPVVVAALGPKMLQLAAERTAGTVTWMTGPRP